MEKYMMRINGEEAGERLPEIKVLNPADSKVIATVPNGGRDEAQAAVDAAHSAFKEWSAYSAYERSELLFKWHELIEKIKVTWQRP